MAFRSDHDAALARADALQRELDAADEARERSEDELEKAKQENLALRAELTEPAKKPKLPYRMRPMKSAPREKRDWDEIVSMGFAVSSSFSRSWSTSSRLSSERRQKLMSKSNVAPSRD